MRTLVLLLLLSFISATAILPQITFERTYGGNSKDRGSSVQQTSDGGYIITGVTMSFGAGSYDVYLIKTDSSGDTLWTRTWGGNHMDSGRSVQQTTDGGYVIAGMTNSIGAGQNDVYLIRTDSSGETLWTRTYGGESYDSGSSVQQTTDGGYIIAGSTGSWVVDSLDIYLIKTDSSGDTLWTRTYGSDGNDGSFSVQQTTDGGYVVVGSWDSWAVYLIKTDSSGNTLWTRTYGGDDSANGKSVQQTTDGGYIITGLTYSFSSGPIHDVYLIKTDSSGDTLWTRTYGGDGSEFGESVQQTTDGGYVIAGSMISDVGHYDAFLIKTDSSGDVLWARKYGGDYYNYFSSVQQTADGGYVMAGNTKSSGDDSTDVYLIKTDPDGYVGISENNPPSPELPRSWALSQNYPNPFNPTTTITFDVPGTQGEAQHVKLTIYDIRGKQVIKLINSEYEPGTHRVVWNGRNDKGEQISSGIYLYTLRSGENIYTRKMVLLK